MSIPTISFALFPQNVGGSDLLRSFTPFRLIGALFALVVAWIAIRFVSRLLGAMSKYSPRARFLSKSLEPVFRIAIWFGAIFIALDLISPSEQTFLAAIGSLALAIGLGAQDLIRNLIGGLVILADRPYQLGDRVKMGDAYGEIDHIGLRSTKLTTPEDTRVTIPNADILTSKAFNANSGVPDCQVVTELFLPIDTDPEIVRRIGYEAALASPFCYLVKPVSVLVSDGFDKMPYLKLRVKAYVFDHRYESRMMSDITARVKTELRSRNLLASWGELPPLEQADSSPGLIQERSS